MVHQRGQSFDRGEPATGQSEFMGQSHSLIVTQSTILLVNNCLASELDPAWTATDTVDMTSS